MPIVFRWNGFKFFFFSNEGDPREPLHIHIRKSGDLAKFWVHPKVNLAQNAGFSAKELREIEEQISTNRSLIEKAWYEHFDE